MIPGQTSQTATQTYFTKHALHPSKLRKVRDVSVSSMAIGTYLGDSNDTTDRLYEESLVHAAQNGVNFFDTAVNYRCQRSERNIAYALRKLDTLGIKRDQIFVSTKGGFLPADSSPSDFKTYVYKTFLNTGLIAPEDIVDNCHCLTPDFIKAMIQLSLQNLKLQTIDLYYLHNPENQLPVLGESGFYKRLTQIFAVLEQAVQDEQIGCYGLATWDGLRLPFGEKKRLDLERVMACAREAAGDKHHLVAIQLPYNLAMLEAVAIPNQKIRGEDFPVIPAAVHHGLSVMTSAPLMQSHVLPLVEKFAADLPGEGSAVQRALQFVMSSPGVVSAMVGTKTKVHFDENMSVLQQDNWPVSDLQRTAEVLVRGRRL